MRHLALEDKPAPIQRVVQRTEDDCSICCIAMATGLPYETVISEVGQPQLIQSLKAKRLQDYQRVLNDKIIGFLGKRGFGLIGGQSKSVNGRRYIANIAVRHPETNEPSALEHSIVIDENGTPIDPSPDGKLPYHVSELREIVFMGTL
jgi:hypothetical protein